MPDDRGRFTINQPVPRGRWYVRIGGGAAPPPGGGVQAVRVNGAAPLGVELEARVRPRITVSNLTGYDVVWYPGAYTSHVSNIGSAKSGVVHGDPDVLEKQEEQLVRFGVEGDLAVGQPKWLRQGRSWGSHVTIDAPPPGGLSLQFEVGDRRQRFGRFHLLVTRGSSDYVSHVGGRIDTGGEARFAVVVPGVYHVRLVDLGGERVVSVPIRTEVVSGRWTSETLRCMEQSVMEVNLTHLDASPVTGARVRVIRRSPGKPISEDSPVVRPMPLASPSPCGVPLPRRSE